MSLHKFYQAIDGDFEAACRRFYNENMLQKFLIRFLDEPCCAELNDALGRHDRDAAIKAVHTLTGQARSFGFIRLEKKSAALLQALRGTQDEEITELRYEVTTEYIRQMDRRHLKRIQAFCKGACFRLVDEHIGNEAGLSVLRIVGTDTERYIGPGLRRIVIFADYFVDKHDASSVDIC